MNNAVLLYTSDMSDFQLGLFHVVLVQFWWKKFAIREFRPCWIQFL